MSLIDIRSYKDKIVIFFVSNKLNNKPYYKTLTFHIGCTKKDQQSNPIHFLSHFSLTEFAIYEARVTFNTSKKKNTFFLFPKCHSILILQAK